MEEKTGERATVYWETNLAFAGDAIVRSNGFFLRSASVLEYPFPRLLPLDALHRGTILELNRVG